MEYKLQMIMTAKEAQYNPTDRNWQSSVSFTSNGSLMPEVECDLEIRFFEKSVNEKLDPNKVYEIIIRECKK